jgi:hypothetical protein
MESLSGLHRLAGVVAGGSAKICNEPRERVRARFEALVKANAAPRCGARSKRTGKPCQAAAMPNGPCKVHGGKSTGARTPEGLERSRKANWKHGTIQRRPRQRVARRARHYSCCAVLWRRSMSPEMKSRNQAGAPCSSERRASAKNSELGCAVEKTALIPSVDPKHTGRRGKRQT